MCSTRPQLSRQSFDGNQCKPTTANCLLGSKCSELKQFLLALHSAVHGYSALQRAVFMIIWYALVEGFEVFETFRGLYSHLHH